MSSHDFSIQVSAGHPAFIGHFPGHPILPGVVLLAEVLAGAERCLGLPMDRIMIRVAKFHAPVSPGSTLAVQIEQGNGIVFTIACDGTRVASGTLALDSMGLDPAALASIPHGSVPSQPSAADGTGSDRTLAGEQGERKGGAS